MIRTSIFIFLIITILSCDRGPTNFEGGLVERQAPPHSLNSSPVPEGESASRKPLIDQKVIRDGVIKFETKDLKSSRRFISDLCNEFGAYVQEEVNDHAEYQLSTAIVLRIPSLKYDDVVSKIEEHAFTLTEKNIKVVDVTDQFIDIQARLKAKYVLERRFLDLLKRAKNVEEVLSVESQMSGVRYEIESMEGKLRSLNDRVALSTLKLNFYQVIPYPTYTPPSYATKLREALQSGWDILLSIFVGVVFMWPFIIFFTIGVILMRRWKRKHRESTPQTS